MKSSLEHGQVGGSEVALAVSFLALKGIAQTVIDNQAGSNDKKVLGIAAIFGARLAFNAARP